MVNGQTDRDLLLVRSWDTAPEDLMRIAQMRPDLHPLVLQHPQVYPELVAWINAQPVSVEFSATQAGVLPTGPAVADPYFVPAVAESDGGKRSKKNRSKPVFVAVGIVLLIMFLVAGGYFFSKKNSSAETNLNVVDEESAADRVVLTEVIGGVWELASLEASDAPSSTSLTDLSKTGTSLTFYAGGRVVADMADKTLQGRWEPAGPTSVVATFEASVLEAQVTQGQLLLTETGSDKLLIFARPTGASASSSPELEPEPTATAAPSIPAGSLTVGDTADIGDITFRLISVQGADIRVEVCSKTFDGTFSVEPWSVILSDSQLVRVPEIGGVYQSDRGFNEAMTDNGIRPGQCKSGTMTFPVAQHQEITSVHYANRFGETADWYVR